MIPIRSAMHLVSDTELHLFQSLWEVAPPEWSAICEWCRLHGMDPKRMPCGQVIVRDVEHCRVVYDQIVLNDEGKPALERGDLDDPSTWHYEVRRVHAQGETPPVPFPDVILAHLNPRETA